MNSPMLMEAPSYAIHQRLGHLEVLLSDPTEAARHRELEAERAALLAELHSRRPPPHAATWWAR